MEEPLRADGLRLVEPGGRFAIDYGELWQIAGPQPSPENLGRIIEGEWGWSYEQAFLAPRGLRAFSVGSATWLWDTSPVTDEEPENRLIGVYGLSSRPEEPRDKHRLAGFPLPHGDDSTQRHRGHALAHSVGGPDEGWNLFAQDARVNLGRGWRSLERYCAAHPGTFMFVRCVYDDLTSVPRALEYGLVRDGLLEVRRFDNSGAPR